MADATKSVLSLSAADIMSHHVVMVPREMSMQGAARMLARSDVTGAPVVDANGRCIGVLSATDFMRWVEKDRTGAKLRVEGDCMCSAWQLPEGVMGEPSCCVEDCMTKDPVLVAPGTKLGELARLMIDAHIHRVIVVERTTQRPIGIVSSTDILAALARAEAAAEVAPEEDALTPAAR
ncbi:MAG: CBS domain-containing protein [Planctomycetes bacterium]|nr:CBS domain-containing protein [Planctomycetota bacterium]